MDSHELVRMGRHYATGERIRLEWDSGGRIERILPHDGEEETWIAPGLIDLQINGGYGHDFTRRRSQRIRSFRQPGAYGRKA